MSEFRRCLLELDIAGARKLWSETNPDFYQPKNDQEILIMLHHARTQADSVPMAKRLYSHDWLVERALPSGLPDELKPSKERVHSTIVTAVGISVSPTTPDHAPLAAALEKAMADAVNDCYASGMTDPVFVRSRMEEARSRTMKALMG